MRHAARYPIKSAHRKIVAALKKLKSLPYETNVAIEDYVKRIEAWGDGKAVVDGLTPEGRKV